MTDALPMNVQIITTPGGDRMAVLPVDEFDALLSAAEDAFDREAVRRFRDALAAGAEELVPAEIADRLIEGENPVKVWRTYRGLTVQQLADRCGLSQAYLSQIEGGRRTGSAATLASIAAALTVAVEDLMP